MSIIIIIIITTPYSIYCITETWLSDSIFDFEILSCEYTIYHKDRGSCGDGVLTAISESVPSVLISSPADLEVIAVNQNGPTCITLCTVYVNPNSGDDYHKSLLSYPAHVASFADSVTFVGDFSLPDICWSSLIGLSPFSISFCDFVYIYNLSQLGKCPIHVKGNTLDLVLTNAENIVSDLSVTESHALIPSDYLTISFNILYVIQSTQNISRSMFLDYSKADFEALCCHLLEIDFSIAINLLLWKTYGP